MADRFHGTPLSRAHISEDLNALLTELDNSDSGKTGGDLLESLISGAADTAIAANTAKVSATAANIKTALSAASTELGVGLSQSDYPDEKNNLVVGATSGNNGVSIVSSATGVSTLAFRNNTSNNSGEGVIDYSGNTKTMRFMTNGLNTALSIDTSQNATFSGTVEATKYKKAVLAALAIQSSSAGGNTTSETVADRTITIPANTLAAGDRLQVRFAAILDSTGNPGATVKLKITDGAGSPNAYTLMTLQDSSLSGSETAAGGMANLSFLTVGSSGKLDSFGQGFVDNTDGGGAELDSTIDTTTNITISVSIQFGAANAANGMILRELSVVQASI